MLQRIISKHKKFIEKIVDGIVIKFFEESESSVVIYKSTLHIVIYAHNSINLLLKEFKPFYLSHKDVPTIQMKRKTHDMVMMYIAGLYFVNIQIYNLHIKKELELLSTSNLLYLHHIVTKLSFPHWYTIDPIDLENFYNFSTTTTDKSSSVKYSPTRKPAPHKDNAIFLYSIKGIDHYIIYNVRMDRRFYPSDQLLRSKVYYLKYNKFYVLHPNLTVTYDKTTEKPKQATDIMRLKFLILEHLYDNIVTKSDIHTLYKKIINNPIDMFDNGVANTKKESSYRKYYSQLWDKEQRPWTYTIEGFAPI